MGDTRLLSLCLLAAVGVGFGVALGLAIPASPPARKPAAPVAALRGDAGDGCTGASLPERAAQTLVVGLPHVTNPDDPLVREVLDVGVGGVLLADSNVETASQVRRLTNALRAGSPHGLLVATDEEPGRVSSFGALLGRSSSARTLARYDDLEAVWELGRDLGGELAALGVDVVFSPVVDLDDGPARGVIGDRSFSADADVAAAHGHALAAGMAAGGVAPTAKHFPGHGRTRVNSHDHLPVVDTPLGSLRSADLVPFAEQIAAGVPLVMTAHVIFATLDEDLPASLSPATYALLREMGFEGVAITDSTGMGAIHQRWGFPTSAVLAIRAGADAVLTTDGAHARDMRDALVAAVRAGELDVDRLDEAAGRVLALKGRDARAVVCRDVAPAPSMRTSLGPPDQQG